MHVKINYEKNDFVKKGVARKFGFDFGGLEVTHQTVVREVPGSNPGSGKDIYACFFVILL